MRVVRGLGALLVLVAAVVAVPYALVVLGGNPLPEGGVRGLVEALRRPDDGGLLVALCTVVGWVAWLVFTLSVAVELGNLVARRGRRLGRVRVPGLAGPQQVAGALLLAVVAAVLAPAPVPAAPVSTPTPTVTTPTVTTPADRVVAPAPAGQHRSLVPKGHVYVVQRGDDLWSLAERFYGHGREWRQIAAANPDVLTGGPDRLQVGMRLAIPGTVSRATHPGSRVVVRAGDTLSSIAAQEYGDPDRWPEIYAANRHLVADPDEIVVGLVLSVPRTEHTAAASHRPPAGSTPDAQREPDAQRDTTDVRTGHSFDKGSRHGATRAAPADPPPTPVPGPAGRAGSARADPGRPAPTTPAAAPAAPAPTTPTPTPAGPTPAGPTPAAPTPAGPTPAGPTPAAPTPAAPTPAGPTPAGPTPAGPTPASGDAQGSAVGVPVPVGVGIGGLLAAGLVAGLRHRRRVQLAARPVGRRIRSTPSQTLPLQAALGRGQAPLSVEALDLVLRAVALHAHHTGRALPELVAARVSPVEVELVLRTPDLSPPIGFLARGRRWVATAADTAYLAELEGITTAPRAYPTLVTVGVDERGRQVLVELEQAGCFGYAGFAADEGEALVLAMATELAFAPWADELFVTLVGTGAELPKAAARHNLTRAADVGALLDRLERRAEVQRRHLEGATARQQRVDPELSDPWAPEVVLVAGPLPVDQEQRLRRVVGELPRVTTAVVLPCSTHEVAAGMIRHPSPAGSVVVQLHPLGWSLEAQQLGAAAEAQVVALLAATGSTDTTPAPWWDASDDPQAAALADLADLADPADPDPTDQISPPTVTVLTPTPRRAWANEEDAAVARLSADPTGPVHHPTVLLLGPLDLVGATGIEPPRAARQCLEYCAWLLEHPMSTAPAMAAALAVAEGTRRSNVSRLRSWLGESAAGEPYLPDAYSGRITLDPAVSSDWQRMQIFTAAGINRTSTDGLQSALELVRGAPLADAAPGQWHWAEELRTDMASAVRDLGVELADRALTAHDLDLARWAASRALVAAPEDEQLLCARIRTEHLAGHTAEVQRLSLRMAGQARTLGVDLDPDTVTLLQQVLEGRVRARLG